MLRFVVIRRLASSSESKKISSTPRLKRSKAEVAEERERAAMRAQSTGKLKSKAASTKSVVKTSTVKAGSKAPVPAQAPSVEEEDKAAAVNREKWVAIANDPNMSLEMIADAMSEQDLAPEFRGIDMVEFDRKWDIAWDTVHKAEESLRLLDRVEDTLESLNAALVSSFDAQMHVEGLSDVERDNQNKKWIKKGSSFMNDYDALILEHSKLQARSEKAHRRATEFMETGKGDLSDRSFDTSVDVELAKKVKHFKELVLRHVGMAPKSRVFLDEEDEDGDILHDESEEDEGPGAFFGGLDFGEVKAQPAKRTSNKKKGTTGKRPSSRKIKEKD